MLSRLKSLTGSHKVITTGGKKLRSSKTHSEKNFDLVDTWCLNPKVLLSHQLEAPAIMKDSRFRCSGPDAMSLGSVSRSL
jgi:hypothetical protein